MGIRSGKKPPGEELVARQDAGAPWRGKNKDP